MARTKPVQKATPENFFEIPEEILPAATNPPRPIDDEGQPLTALDEFGVAGAKIYSGYVEEEFLRKLVGDKGRAVYREMRDNDPTVGAILFAIEMLLRATPWTIEIETEGLETSKTPNADVAEGVDLEDIGTPEGACAFLESVLFDDMDHTWEDFIANVLTMLTFGWQYTEVVFKRRMGLSPADPRFKSKYDDGLIGIKKLGNRAQETLDKWLIGDNGDILGMYQTPPNAGAVRFIPMSKSLLFRPTPNKDSPEGRSVLRNAYRPWYMLKNIQEIEAIAIERELNGLPVVKIPNALLSSSDDKKKAIVARYVKLVRDIKFNSQGGVVLPSDPYTDQEGKPVSVSKVSLELLNAGGTRAIDTNKTIMRYQGDIARSVLADFIMLGQGDKGSFALSRSKADLFLGALEGWNNSIAAVINRCLVPMLWELNGMDMDVMPYAKPGRVAPEDLEELGNFIEKLSRAGFTLAPDEDTENHLRGVAGLPEREYTDEELAAEEAIGVGLRPEEKEVPPAGKVPPEEEEIEEEIE